MKGSTLVCTYGTCGLLDFSKDHKTCLIQVRYSLVAFVLLKRKNVVVSVGTDTLCDTIHPPVLQMVVTEELKRGRIKMYIVLFTFYF